MNPIRAFVALNLPRETIVKVAELQRELKQAADDAGLRVVWVPSSNIHVTLRFLGEIPAESATAIADVLRAHLAGRAPLHLEVRGVGAFPDRARPRVLWVGVDEASDGVTRLASEVDAWLADLGFEPDKRDFHAHLTLGRVKQGQADIVSALAERDLGSCTAQEVVLYQSVLQRKGAEYTALCRVRLESAGV